MLTIISNTGFVTPLNLGLIFFCPRFDFWVGVIEPMLNRFGTSLIRTLERFLGCKSPSLHVVTNSPNRDPHPPHLVNDRLNGFSVPQSKWEFKLLWVLLGQKLTQKLFLIFRKQSLLLRTTATFLQLNGICSTFSPGPDPVTKGDVIYTDNFGDVFACFTVIKKADCKVSVVLLNLLWKASGVMFCHDCTTHCLRLFDHQINNSGVLTFRKHYDHMRPKSMVLSLSFATKVYFE